MSPDPAEAERQLDDIAHDLKDQMQLARDRISDRYAKLMEERSFEPEFKPTRARRR
jgi:hypothetical protein